MPDTDITLSKAMRNLGLFQPGPSWSNSFFLVERGFAHAAITLLQRNDDSQYALGMSTVIHLPKLFEPDSFYIIHKAQLYIQTSLHKKNN